VILRAKIKAFVAANNYHLRNAAIKPPAPAKVRSRDAMAIAGHLLKA
jgi:hypothetical protein